MDIQSPPLETIPNTLVWQRRGLYLALAVITMMLGLLSRSDLIPLPAIIEDYAGDALWAMLIFWCFRILVSWQPNRTRRSPTATVMATITCFGVELSQLYQAPWINSIRNTTLGGLILGFGFKWSDLLLYLLGIALAIILDHLLTHGTNSAKVTQRVHD